jgi:hypothetical protein
MPYKFSIEKGDKVFVKSTTNTARTYGLYSVPRSGSIVTVGDFGWSNKIDNWYVEEERMGYWYHPDDLRIWNSLVGATDYPVYRKVSGILESEEPQSETPDHYTAPNGTKVDELIAHLPFFAGNVIKYVFRAGEKNADTHLEDLLKAKRSLEIEIDRIKND